MFKLSHWAAGPALLASAVSAHAQMQPASAEQLGEAAGACLAAVDGDGPLPEELGSLGWERATISSKGKAVDSPLGMFGKSGNDAIILVSKPDNESGASCVVIARLASTKLYHPTAEAISRIVGPPTKREDNIYFWSLDGKAAQLAPTGTRDEPALRFVIVSLEGNSP